MSMSMACITKWNRKRSRNPFLLHISDTLEMTQLEKFHFHCCWECKSCINSLLSFSFDSKAVVLLKRATQQRNINWSIKIIPHTWSVRWFALRPWGSIVIVGSISNERIQWKEFHFFLSSAYSIIIMLFFFYRGAWWPESLTIETCKNYALPHCQEYVQQTPFTNTNTHKYRRYSPVFAALRASPFNSMCIICVRLCLCVFHICMCMCLSVMSIQPPLIHSQSLFGGHVAMALIYSYTHVYCMYHTIPYRIPYTNTWYDDDIIGKKKLRCRARVCATRLCAPMNINFQRRTMNRPCGSMV